MKELLPFLSMFISFISAFSLFQYIMSNEVEDAADTYPGVDSFTRMFI